MSDAWRGVARQTVGTLFATFAEFLVEAAYRRGDATLATARVLVMPVPAARVDGVTVQPNDERVLVDAAEVTAAGPLRPGDYLLATAGGQRRDVVTAHLDVTGTHWVLTARRVFS